jgi:hypothetical protein
MGLTTKHRNEFLLKLQHNRPIIGTVAALHRLNLNKGRDSPQQDATMFPMCHEAKGLFQFQSFRDAKSAADRVNVSLQVRDC